MYRNLAYLFPILRFSYLPAGSSTPRRFRCQPELALQELAEGASPTERKIVREIGRAHV